MSEVEVGEHWQELVKGLQTELEHPIEAFLLPDSSDRIRRFRDVLRSPIAQRLARDGAGGDYCDLTAFKPATLQPYNPETLQHLLIHHINYCDLTASRTWHPLLCRGLTQPAFASYSVRHHDKGR